MKTKSIFLFLLTFSIFPSIGFAADVTLAWDPVATNDVVGYRIYAREAGETFDYGYPEQEVADSQCTLTGFDEYETYYFIVRAVDAYGNESGDSNEVFWDPSGVSGNDAAYLSSGDAGGQGSSGGCFISALLGE